MWTGIGKGPNDGHCCQCGHINPRRFGPLRCENCGSMVAAGRGARRMMNGEGIRDSSTSGDYPHAPLPHEKHLIYLDRTDLKVFIVSVIVGGLLYWIA